MIQINNALRPADLQKKVERLWEVSAPKILALDRIDDGNPPPEATVQGRWTARAESQSARGFAYGSALLQFDAFWEERFLTLGRTRMRERMDASVTNFGSHDHGFANVSTFGNLWRLLGEKRLSAEVGEREFCELALKASGAVQAQRWTYISNGEGFIHSAHGPHSLFAESIRSLRSLGLAHRLGQTLLGERDESFSLLRRLLDHARTTAKWSVYYGTGRDIYDTRGRVAQESVFDIVNGSYCGPGSPHGYSPFSTCTRALAAVMLGYSEQLEYLSSLEDGALERIGGREAVEAVLLNAARASSDFYLEQTPTDGIPYWDTGAPGLQYLGAYLERPADPFNDFEPVDSSAAAVAAQALLRLGNWLTKRGQFADAERYWQAGLTVLNTLFEEPYLSTNPQHQGLILHSISQRPSGADYIPEGRRIPCGEATLAGDYHAREAALFLQRVYEEKPYLTFFGS